MIRMLALAIVALATVAAAPLLPTAHADPTQTIVIDDPSASVVEGAVCTSSNPDCTLKVHLATQPATNVAVTFTVSRAGKISWLPNPLAFTPSDFATDKNLLVIGRQDADDLDEDLTLTLSTAGADPAVVAVHVIDDD